MDFPETTKVDRKTGVREHAAFVAHAPDGDRIFCVTHRPPGDPRAAVLVCSSVYADFLANYQREVNLARHLSTAGFIVMRFHYRGTGNSDGNPDALTPLSLSDDAAWAAARLRESAGSLPFALVGTRWGALCAASAAGRHPGSPLVLVEPVIDAGRYFREAVRSRAMSAIASGADEGRGAQIEDLFEARGFADIVGNVIYRPFYDTAVERPALEFLQGSPRPALLVQFGGRQLRAEYRSLERELTTRRWSVETATIDLTESWWFRAAPRVLVHEELNRLTDAWIQRCLSPAAHV